MAQERPAIFARTRFRRDRRAFGVRPTDRLSHLYAIGRTGVGKSTLLETLAVQDLAAGDGLAVIDPHGDLAEAVIARARRLGVRGVVYLDAADPDQPFGYNPLHRVAEAHIPLAAAGILETLRKLWPEAWGVRMEHVLRNSLYLLLERDEADLSDILRLYADKAYRAAVTHAARNDVVRDFWRNEFEAYPPRLKAEAVAPIQNKLGALLADPRMYRLLVAPEIDLRFRAMMDRSGALVVNLARGKMGEDAARLLGGLIVSTIGLAAFSRADAPAHERRPFWLHVDEFQTFTTLAFVGMMSELRKYGVGLTLANQHLAQLDPEIRHAVLGNAGTLVAFRVGPEDAFVLAQEFQPTFGVLDLLNLANGDICLKMMIDGAPSKPFSARVLTADQALGATARAGRERSAARAP